MLLQNLAVFERNDDSSTDGDESGEESDGDTSDTQDSDDDSIHAEDHKDNSAQQTIHNCQVPRIKMPNTSSKRRLRPRIEVVQDPDNSNIRDVSHEQLH